MDFTKIGTDVKTPKVKTSSLGVNIAPSPPHFAPTKPPISGDEVLKMHAHINNNPITTLNVRESPKFPRPTGNRGRGTR